MIREPDGANSDQEEPKPAPKKRGRKVNPVFPNAPVGDMSHPFVEWTVDQPGCNESIHAKLRKTRGIRGQPKEGKRWGLSK